LPAASFKVEVAWNSAVSAFFKLDISALDGGATLFDPTSGDFAGAYDDVSFDVEEIRIKRGRNDVLKGMQAGEADFTLYNPSNPDFYNPNAPSGVSPIAGETPGFAPMRPVRITATYGATTYSLFYGFIRSAEWDSESKRCRVNAVDLFIWLSRVTPTFTAVEAAAEGVDSTSTAIGYVLDAAGFTDPTKRDLDVSGGDPLALTDYDNTTALSIIEELLEAERGVFVVRGDGVAQYRDRHARYEEDSVATFQTELVRYGSGLDLDRIVNRQSVTRQDSARTDVYTATSTDANSVNIYGLADGSSVASPYIVDNDTADALALWLVGSQSVPQPPIELQIDNQDDATILLQMTLDIGDRVTAPVQYDPFTFGVSTFGGIGSFVGTLDYHIEQITHEITEAGLAHRTAYALSERGSEYLRFGTLPIGTDASPSEFGNASAVFGF